MGVVKKSRNSDGTRRKLLDSAIMVFSRRGYAGSTVDEIVAKAGFSKGAFYNHFNTKEEAFFELLHERLSRNRRRFAQVCRWTGDPEDWIHSVFHHIFCWAEENPRWASLSVEFMAEGMKDERIGGMIDQLLQEWRGMLSEVITSELGEASLITDPDTIASAILALVDGFIIHGTLDRSDHLGFESLASRLAPAIASWFTGEP